MKCCVVCCSSAMRSTLNMMTTMSMLMVMVRAMKKPTERQRRNNNIVQPDSCFSSSFWQQQRSCSKWTCYEQYICVMQQGTIQSSPMLDFSVNILCMMSWTQRRVLQVGLLRGSELQSDFLQCAT